MTLDSAHSTSSETVVSVDDDEDDVDTSAEELTGEEFLTSLQSSVVGHNASFATPFGPRPVVYVDYTASGRSLRCIEDYIRSHVMPFYGNTHTTTSVTGLQSTTLREEARDIIAQSVNADKQKDVVIFTGTGSTGAIHKLVHALGINAPMRGKPPVVFVGPFEHHSNLLPWRESGAEVVQVHENAHGQVDLHLLTRLLKKYADRPLKIGTFSAASNVTGILSDVNQIASILHTHGALAFFDYASCAPYVEIDMNPGSLQYKDAVFFSGHKFLGGPGSPGILVVKKKIMQRAVPTGPGGGTVLYVTEQDHYYINHIEEREEGGTPDTIGAIRLGLAFQVKQRVGIPTIMDHEHDNLDKALERLQALSHVVLLGPGQSPEKLPIFSFLIRCGNRFLHYNFVGALLNDLFGIQSRGGCSCAGPYGQRLLGISDADTHKFKAVLRQNDQVLKPGYSRLSLPYILSDAEVEYVIAAVEFVAMHGWKFLPQYQFTEATGEWAHYSKTKKPQTSLRSFLSVSTETVLTEAADYNTYLREAAKLAKEAVDNCNKVYFDKPGSPLSSKKEPLRWFVYPWEVVKYMQSKERRVYVPLETLVGPVTPHEYVQNLESQASTRHSSLGRLSLWERLKPKGSDRSSLVAPPSAMETRISLASSDLAHMLHHSVR